MCTAALRRAKLGARAVFVSLHLLYIILACFTESDVVRWWRAGRAWPIVALCTVFVATMAQYFYTALADPGYIMDDMSPESLSGREKGSETEGLLASVHIVHKLSDVHVLSPRRRENKGTPLSFDAESGTDPVCSMDSPLSPKPASGAVHPVSESPWRRNESSTGRRCPYCRLWQPLRAKHCHDCDLCVLRFDHHCFWLGACVGQRNHAKFWLYLLLHTVLGLQLILITFSITNPKPARSFWLSTRLLAICAGIFASIAWLFVAGLWLFHSYLALSNQTTWEVTSGPSISYLRNAPSNVAPFNHGVLNNLRDLLSTTPGKLPMYSMPTSTDMTRRATMPTLWENQYYSCW
eukprot:jgi/Chlat1/535/Chrsp103S00013